jgi:rhodanese-related sulfurtransferase
MIHKLYHVSTIELIEFIENNEAIIVDVRPIDAYNG